MTAQKHDHFRMLGDFRIPKRPFQNYETLFWSLESIVFGVGKGLSQPCKASNCFGILKQFVMQSAKISNPVSLILDFLGGGNFRSKAGGVFGAFSDRLWIFFWSFSGPLGSFSDRFS